MKVPFCVLYAPDEDEDGDEDEGVTVESIDGALGETLEDDVPKEVGAVVVED